MSYKDLFKKWQKYVWHKQGFSLYFESINIMAQKKRNRQRVNRYKFTINNPFITDDVKALSLDNLTDEQKELYEKSYNRNDFTHLKDLPYFDFAVCE